MQQNAAGTVAVAGSHDQPQNHVGANPYRGGRGRAGRSQQHRDRQGEVTRDEKQQVQSHHDDHRHGVPADALVKILGEPPPQRSGVGVHAALGNSVAIGEHDALSALLEHPAQSHVVHHCGAHRGPAADGLQRRAPDHEQLAVGRQHPGVAGPVDQRHRQPGDIGQMQQRHHHLLAEAAGELPGNGGHQRGAEAARYLFRCAEQRQHAQYPVLLQGDVGVDVQQHLTGGLRAQAVQGVRLADPTGWQAHPGQYPQPGNLLLQTDKDLGGAVGGAVVVDDDLDDRTAGGVGGPHAAFDIGHLVAGRDQHTDTARCGEDRFGLSAPTGPEQRIERHQTQRQQGRDCQQDGQRPGPGGSGAIDQGPQRQVRIVGAHARIFPAWPSSLPHRPSLSPENSGSHMELGPSARWTRIRTRGRRRSESTRSGTTFSPMP